MTLNNINRILIIKLREIGDLLLTTPVVTAIKEKYPHSYIAVCVNSGTQDIVTQNPLIDKVYAFDRSWKRLPFIKKALYQLKFAWNIRKEHFDLIIDFTSGDRAATYALLSGAKYKIAYETTKGFWGKKYIYTHKIPRLPYPKHEVEKNLDLVRPFGIDTKNKSPRTYFQKKDQQFIQETFKNHHILKSDLKIHIHPTSKWLFKCWKDDYFAKLIDLLTKQYNVKIFLSAGPSKKEQDKIEKIYTLCENKPIPIFEQKTTLKHMAALSHMCDLFIGIDTGPMHIAASVNTPVIVLFGPSGPTEWAPWGSQHTVIQSKEFDCMPCGQDGCNKTKKSKCLESITVEMVKKETDKKIMQIMSKEKKFRHENY